MTTTVQKRLDLNYEARFKRNQERYTFMKWGHAGFDTFRVVPRESAWHQVTSILGGVHRKEALLPDTGRH